MTLNPVRKLLLILMLTASVVSMRAASITSIAPASWWVNMPEQELLILINGKDLFGAKVTINYPGVTVIAVTPSVKQEYILLEISIAPNTTPGIVPIVVSDNKRGPQTINLTLNVRQPDNSQPLTASDAIYDVMIDRFANGNTANDKPPYYLEAPDRTNPSGIHGGDLAGLIYRLDHIKNLGFTTLKLSPLQENNQFKLSYTGSASTNFYAMDARIGTMAEYGTLKSQCKSNNIKIIQSYILHQAGGGTGVFFDKPYPSWLLPDYKNYDFTPSPIPVVDTHASINDVNTQLKLWRSSMTPLLNQEDKNLTRYIVQSLIWWIENTQPDAIEIKSAWQNTPEFLDIVLKTLNETYPSLQVILDAPFKRENHLMAWINRYRQYKNILINDFPLTNTIADAFSGFTIAAEGSSNLYNAIASDILYPNASINIVSADNPMLNRAWNNADKDPAIFKLMLSYILTTRGIPSIQYGTETLMDGISKQNEHLFYKDFPGGWNTDQYDFFNSRNHTNNQAQIVNLISSLLKWRSYNQKLLNAPLVHFAPRRGIYTYHRTIGNHTMMVIINNNKEPQRIEFRDYPEVLARYSQAKDIVTGEVFTQTGSILIQSKSCVVIELTQLMESNQ